MGNQLAKCIQFTRPLVHTGIDYCEPFFIKKKRHRNRGKVKYVDIFVCLANKAVHFELVSDHITEAFLASLKRFFSRHGKSTFLTSDHATNFVGANRELAQLHELLLSNKRNEAVQQFLAKQRVSWTFIPPRSPHFDGLWEAGVKSFKPYLSRNVGNMLLTLSKFRPCDWDWGYFKFPSSFLLLPILLIVALWFLNVFDWWTIDELFSGKSERYCC